MILKDSDKPKSRDRCNKCIYLFLQRTCTKAFQANAIMRLWYKEYTNIASNIAYISLEYTIKLSVLAYNFKFSTERVR